MDEYKPLLHGEITLSSLSLDIYEEVVPDIGGDHWESAEEEDEEENNWGNGGGGYESTGGGENYQEHEEWGPLVVDDPCTTCGQVYY